MIHIIEVVVLALLAGVCGRLGGWEKGNRLFRILGVPLCATSLVALFHFHWSLIICFGLVLGATSTYFKKKGQDATWWNWALVGLAECLAFLPYVFFTHYWLGLLIRTIVCTGLLVLWDELIGIDWLEESGRYFIVVGSLPLLFI